MIQEKNNYHIPVLLKECIKALNIRSDCIYCDATLGGGGHSQAILEENHSVKLYSFDQDPDAIAETSFLKEKFGDRIKIIHDNFVNLRTRLALERVKKIDGIIFDLGISSHQIDEKERGFSYMKDGRLDMRMNQTSKITAENIVNEYSQTDLIRIFKEYGEERESFAIAQSICNFRKNEKITSTVQLADIIDKATRSQKKIKARSRIFQAIRIEINQELKNLKSALKDSVNLLNPGGRIVVLTYNSLEDRITKQYFNYETKDCICPSLFPRCNCNKIKRLEIHKSIIPSEVDLLNVRARSARLRYATRVTG